MPPKGGLKGPDKSTLIMSFFAAASAFILFLSFVNTPQEKPHENLHYGSFNTSQIAQLHNTTYVKVYYSELCTACAKQLPILNELAVNGTIIELIDVSKEPENTEKDLVIVTPTLFIINGPNYERIDGFATLEEIEQVIEKVTDKSKLSGE